MGTFSDFFPCSYQKLAGRISADDGPLIVVF